MGNKTIRFAFEESEEEEIPTRIDWDTILRNLATVRVFNRAIVEGCLWKDVNNPPPFENIVASGHIQRLAEDVFQMEKGSREIFFRAWWPADAGNALLNQIPDDLREVSACLADAYQSQANPIEALYHLTLANPEAAVELFASLFDDADKRFDIYLCHDLLGVMDERRAFLSPGAAALVEQKRPRLEARSMWAQDFHGTSAYLEREATRDLARQLFESTGHWILQLFAKGGLGKTMFIRAVISRLCVPQGIPCARIDFDVAANREEVASQPWRLLLRIADQMNRQLPLQPFEELLADYAGFVENLGMRRSAYQRKAADLGQAEDARVRVDILERFSETTNDACQDAPYLLVFDTIEELLLRQMDLTAAFELLADLQTRSPGLRVILAGRYNLEDISGQSIPDHLPGFVERFGAVEHTIELKPFSPQEAREYLAMQRGMKTDPRIPTIIDKCDGNPFKLALLADTAINNPKLTSAEIRSYKAVDLVYLIDRVIKRIDDGLLRWVIRYGVTPRILTRDFIDHVMVPFIARGVAGDITFDNPKADKLPKKVKIQELFPEVKDLGKLNGKLLWDALTLYASRSSWVYPTSGVPDALSFHPDIIRPMRYLLRAQSSDKRKIFTELNKAAAKYFEERAVQDPSNRARWTQEAMFHHFQYETPKKAVTYWKSKIAGAAGDPETAAALAEEVLWMARSYAGSPDEQSVLEKPSEELVALAAYQMASLKLESGQPISAEDWLKIKDWYKVAAQYSADHPKLFSPAQIAQVYGHILLNENKAGDSLSICLSGLATPASQRNEMELHLLAAAALEKLHTRTNINAVLHHYRMAYELAGKTAPQRASQIELAMAAASEAGERFETAIDIYHGLFEDALEFQEYNLAAGYLHRVIINQAALGREDQAARSGTAGVTALERALRKRTGAAAKSAPTRRADPSTPAPAFDPIWFGVLRAEIAHSLYDEADALAELNKVMRPGQKAGVVNPVEGSRQWALMDANMRSRIELEHMGLAEILGCYEKLAHDFHPLNSAPAVQALLASASIYIDLTGSPANAEPYLEQVRQNLNSLNPLDGWQARLRLLEIHQMALRGERDEARAAAGQLLNETQPAWPAEVKVLVALECMVQENSTRESIDALISTLAEVQTAARRLKLLDGLRRCPAPEKLTTRQRDFFMTLKPVPKSGESIPLHSLRWAEVLRFLGKPLLARTQLRDVEREAAGTEDHAQPVNLPLLRQVYLAFDRLGWPREKPSKRELPFLDKDTILANRDIAGVTLLEHTWRLAGAPGGLKLCQRLLPVTSAALGVPSSLFNTDYFAVEAIVKLITREARLLERDQDPSGELENLITLLINCASEGNTQKSVQIMLLLFKAASSLPAARPGQVHDLFEALAKQMELRSSSSLASSAHDLATRSMKDIHASPASPLSQIPFQSAPQESAAPAEASEAESMTNFARQLWKEQPSSEILRASNMLGMAIHTVLLSAPSGNRWQVRLEICRPDGSSTNQDFPVHLSDELQEMIAPTDERFGPLFIRQFATDWQVISAGLGELIFPADIEQEFLYGSEPFLLHWNILSSLFSWLPWEMLRPGLDAPPLAQIPSCQFQLRSPFRMAGYPDRDSAESSEIDVLIVRPDEQVEKMTTRSADYQSSNPLGYQYRRSGLQAAEIYAPTPWKLEESAAQMRPRVIHLVASIRGRGQRLLLDFGSESGYTNQQASFSAKELCKTLQHSPGLDLLIIEPPSPPFIHERLRQLCLRNAFIDEMIMASQLAIPILGAGLADRRQQEPLSATLIECIAGRLSPYETARRIRLLASGDDERSLRLEYALPFLGVNVSTAKWPTGENRA